MRKPKLNCPILIILLFLLEILSACKNENVDNVYYHSSTKKFDYDYTEKVNDTKTFLKLFGASFERTILDSFPNFFQWDSLTFFDPLKAKVTLYISNYRETYLEFCCPNQPELVIKATDVPIQDAIFYGMELFYPYRPAGNIKEMIYNYDNSHPMILLKNFAFREYYGTLLRYHKPLEFESGEYIVLEHVLYQQLDSNIYPINAAFLTDVNGFGQIVDKASNLGNVLATQDVQNLLIHSEYFRHIIADKYLSPLAEYMQIRIANKNKGLDTYPTSEFKRDTDSLYKLGLQHHADSAYVDFVRQFTTDPRHYFLWKYSSPKGLLLQWCLLNLSFILIIVVFKRQLIRRIDAGRKWTFGIVFGANLSISTYFWNNLDPFYFVLPWLLAFAAMVYMSYDKATKKYITQ